MKGKTCIIVKFHRPDSVIYSQSKERKTLSYKYGNLFIYISVFQLHKKVIKIYKHLNLSFHYIDMYV